MDEITSVETAFWGVRGSFPQSNVSMSEFGGHTSCVSVHANKELVIIDAGTGMIELSRWMEVHRKKEATLLLSHLHYDHCLGLLFFNQLWDPNFSLKIVSPHNSIETTLKRLISAPFSAFSWDDFKAKIEFVDLIPETLWPLSPTLSLETINLVHPGGSFGYRLKSSSKKGEWTVAYLSDHIYNPLQDPIQAQKIISFTERADLLIHDAHFTEEELTRFSSWGHSSWEGSIHLANKAKVKNLALFHHHPDREDAALLEIEKQAQRSFPLAFAARQGQSISFTY